MTQEQQDFCHRAVEDRSALLMFTEALVAAHLGSPFPDDLLDKTLSEVPGVGPNTARGIYNKVFAH